METRPLVGLASVLAVWVTLSACDKPDTTTPPAASQSAAPLTGEPAASVTAAAPSVTAATPSAAAAEPSTTASAPTAKGSPTDAKRDGGAAPAGSATALECGTKPLPDCPLQAWMKANVNPPITANDGPGLAAALDKTVAFAPPGYTNWASIAKDGANAARANDMSAAKASCRTCHDQYKAKYKTEMRARKI